MLEKLLAIQKRERLVDREMAERLNVARSTWTEVRNGRRRLTEAMQMSAARAFPELLAGLVMSVSESGRPRRRSAAPVTTEAA